VSALQVSLATIVQSAPTASRARSVRHAQTHNSRARTARPVRQTSPLLIVNPAFLGLTDLIARNARRVGTPRACATRHVPTRQPAMVMEHVTMRARVPAQPAGMGPSAKAARRIGTRRANAMPIAMQRRHVAGMVAATHRASASVMPIGQELLAMGAQRASPGRNAINAQTPIMPLLTVRNALLDSRVRDALSAPTTNGRELVVMSARRAGTRPSSATRSATPWRPVVGMAPATQTARAYAIRAGREVHAVVVRQTGTRRANAMPTVNKRPPAMETATAALLVNASAMHNGWETHAASVQPA
jgi:hypothetical protein